MSDKSFDQVYEEIKALAVAEAKELKKRMVDAKSDISAGQVRAICERHFGGIEVAALTNEFVDEVTAALSGKDAAKK